jgi:hypothetical protein
MTAVSKHPARRTFLKQSAALSGAFVLGLQAGYLGNCHRR